tara:strand:+ start:2030 stop:2659 length:630 start_codon:yes stop_codon:yes gene_type:complete
MKIAITGHSRGIGKAVYEKLQEREGYEFRGYSRSNGYDIGVNYQKVIDEIIEWDADVVFNNAWSWQNNAQNLIVKQLHEAWADVEKVIISTGSSSGYYGHNPSESYASNKIELMNYHVKASLDWPTRNKTRCQSISFGYVQTSILEDTEDAKNYIPVKDAAELMINLIEPRNYIIADQLVTHRYTDWDQHDRLRSKINENVLKYWINQP